MEKLNIELKAHYSDLDRARALLEPKTRLVGVDEQQDTYFQVPEGRLKVRQGPIENSVVFYRRDDRAEVRSSEIQLVELAAEKAEEVRTVLEQALGVMKVVKKTREIRFMDNVKIHLDRLEGLGTFVELEAIQEGDLTKEELHAQVQGLRELLGIDDAQIESRSYSDMV